MDSYKTNDSHDGKTRLRRTSRSENTDNMFFDASNKEKTKIKDLFVQRKDTKPFPLAVLFSTLKVMIVALILIGCACFGLVLGVAKAYVDTTPELDVSQLTKSDRTSFIYDKDGDLITTFSGLEYRDWVEIDEIPDMLKNAVIAIEDVRFYKHNGVDIKRLVSAIINTFLNQNTHGGSTITQQLIKNKILSNEQSYKRKIQEAYLALELENTIDKDHILEAYMNDVYLGESNYGVKAAAEDYFGKELSELSIRECAMIAGLIQKPYYTNPRANTYTRTYTEGEKKGQNKMDITEERTNTVIWAMYDAGFITSEQRETALNDKVKILQFSEQKQMYDMPYFVEYAIYDVVTHMLIQRNMLDTKENRTSIENELRTGGYHIYTTVDTQMQHLVQDTITNWDKYPELADPSTAIDYTSGQGIIQPQASAVVFDYHTGELRAIIGGRTPPTVKKAWNRAYMSNNPVGSSIKPIAVYGPALDLGASPATIIANFPGEIEGYGGKGYPALGSSKWMGPVTIRRGVVSSLNVVAARTLFEYVTPATSTDYLANLGIDRSRINSDGPGLALGTSGITPIEMAAAFGAIANGGEYIEPMAFTRVVDSNGKIIIDANDVRETRQVFKRSTAYMLIDMLTNAVNSGTGTRAKIDGMTVAGKTGTNDEYTSAYFAGMTPYYSASIWVGHDQYKNKLRSGSTGGNSAAPLWQAFMSQIHEGYTDKPIMDDSPVQLGLERRTVCSISGLLATEACKHDTGGHTPVTDWFYSDDIPTESCNMHVIVELCSTSHEPASIYCQPYGTTTGSVVLISSESMYSQFSKEDVLAAMPNAVFTDATIEEYAANADPALLCGLHTPPYHGGGDGLSQAVIAANELITDVQTYLNTVVALPETERSTLENGISLLRTALDNSDLDEIRNYTSSLEYNYGIIKGNYPPPAL